MTVTTPNHYGLATGKSQAKKMKGTMRHENSRNHIHSSLAYGRLPACVASSPSTPGWMLCQLYYSGRL
jgi:hypothetical protein